MMRKREPAAVFPAVLVICTLLLHFLWTRGIYGTLSEDACETELFRQMKVTPEIYREAEEFAGEYSCDPMEVLSVIMILERLDPADSFRLEYDTWVRAVEVLGKKREAAFDTMTDAYRAVFGGLECFPLTSEDAGGGSFYYENSFGEPRNYGGSRIHEGCDVFGEQPQRGIYPVLSVCDGYVEKIGWLPLGGYRIGIRSRDGGYFYYAHLDSYGREFQVGDTVRAGEILGLMGDTGYGEEGSRGKFPVHLHFGCYIRTAHQEELSVNSYPILQILEDQKR